jgi:hypothetical protein
MAMDFETRQKQTAAEFWKSYFRKFRRQVGEQEESQTGGAPLSISAAPVSFLVDRRRIGPRLGAHLRR